MNHDDSDYDDSDDCTDVDVLALRYVMAELTADEVTKFEARLAADQDARESVSRMVVLGEAIGRDESVVPASGFGGWRLAIAAVLIVAVGLTVYFGGYFRDHSQGGDENSVPNHPIANGESPLEQEARQLIASWVDFGDLPDVALADAGLDATLDPFEHVEGSEVTLDIGAEAPSWMLQALAK